MTKMPSGRRKVALPRLPFSRLGNRGSSTAASNWCFCRHDAAVDRPRQLDRGTLEGFLSLLCRCCSAAALHARQLGRSLSPLRRLCTNRGTSGSKPPDFPYLRIWPRILQIEPKYPCHQKNLQKPPKKH